MEQDKILEIANKRMKYWIKVDKIRNILQNTESISYNKATIQARNIVDGVEQSHINHDTDYMNNHFSKINSNGIDLDSAFWKEMGAVEEPSICHFRGF